VRRTTIVQGRGRGELPTIVASFAAGNFENLAASRAMSLSP
jgi:hypothetical protein